jgi:hypothetical protein
MQQLDESVLACAVRLREVERRQRGQRDALSVELPHELPRALQLFVWGVHAGVYE